MATQLLVALLLVSVGQVTDASGTDETPQKAVSPATGAGMKVASQDRPPPTAKDVATPSKDDTGIWLVNLARHQGHLVGRSNPRSAALHVLSLLKAAAKTAPACAEAYYWLYDLSFRLDRMDEAKVALEYYVTLQPDDVAARIRHFTLAMEDFQTAEARTKYVKTCLNQKPLPRAYESELRRWLARHYWERRENESAAKEVENALLLNPMNVAARELAYEMFGETEPALQRVEMALQLIAINPTQANLVWDLAEFLDGLSLHKQAQEWYNRAIDLHERAGTGTLSAEFWHRLAMSYLSSNDLPRAKDAASKALEANPSLHAARLLRANVAAKLGLQEESKDDIAFVRKAYLSRVPQIIEQKLATEAAEVAWFFTYHQPDKERAMELTSLAMESPNPSQLARLAHGYALRMNGRTKEAIDVLAPLSRTDQLASLELAKAHIQQGDKSIAMTTLHKAAMLRYSGIAFNLICERLRDYEEIPPSAPPYTKITSVLERFPRDIFNYHREPDEALKFSMRFLEEPIPVAGPINVVFRVENIAPYPITFGEGFMVRPLIALTATIGGKETKTYENYLQVLMSSRPVLMPGDAIEKTAAIDVGPMREHLIRSVGTPITIELAALFDPVYHDEKLIAGAGTITAQPLKISRPALGLSVEDIALLRESAGESSDVATRLRTAETIGAILAFSEHNPKLSGLTESQMESLRVALAMLLSDHDWRVRSRALVAAGWSKLDKRIEMAASPSVRSEDDIVMLLAVRLFAQQHGDRFQDVLKFLSKKNDLSPFVRTMAESFIPQAPAAQANSMANPEDAETGP